MEYTVSACAVRSKQSWRRMATCRFCGALLDEKHTSGLFSTIALQKALPGRFSRLLQLPVFRDDGHSVYCCRKCVGRLNSVEKTIEEMKSLANSSYSKAGYAPPVNSSPLSRNALEKESRTRAVTQLPLTLSTRAFFPMHDRAYERADEKSDEPTSIARSDAKNTEDHGRVYEIVLR